MSKLIALWASYFVHVALAAWIYDMFIHIYIYIYMQGHQVQISSSPRLLIDCHGNFQAIPNAWFLNKLFIRIPSPVISKSKSIRGLDNLDTLQWALPGTWCQGMQALRAELLSEFEAWRSDSSIPSPPRWPNVHPSRWRWWSYVQFLICHNCSSCFIMCPRSFLKGYIV